MNSEWRELTLGAVCTTITDGAHNSPRSVKAGKPMASVKDLTRFGVNLNAARLISNDDFDKLVKQGCKPEVGDVLVAKDGNSALDTACSVRNPLDAVMLSSVAILRPDLSMIETEYLKYYFCSQPNIDYLKSNFISGAAIPRVILKDFRKAKIHLPHLKEQRKIVTVLSSIENKIENNIAINEDLKRINDALFKSWFVDFEPTHAKRMASKEKLDIYQAERAAIAVISGLCNATQFLENIEDMEKQLREKLSFLSKEKVKEIERIASLFPSEFEDHELQKIPKGWSFSDLTRLCDLNKKSWTTKDCPESLIYVDLANTKFGVIEDVAHYTWEKAPSRAKRVLSNGDTIIGTVRPGNCSFSYIYHQEEQLTGSTGFAVLTPKEKIYQEFVYIFSTSKESIEYLAHRADGGAYPAVKGSDVVEMKTAIPSDELLEVFHGLTEPMLSLIKRNQLENTKLEKLRDTLLPKLLAGEIDLGKIEEDKESL